MSSNASWILVVDDDPAITELLRFILIKEGYAVSTASSAEAAWTEVLAHPPALAILDVELPGMNGYALCRKLRQDAATQAIPILMLTSKSEIGDKIAGFEAGADDYLLKPFEKDYALRCRFFFRRSRAATQSATDPHHPRSDQKYCRPG